MENDAAATRSQKTIAIAIVENANTVSNEHLRLFDISLIFIF